MGRTFIWSGEQLNEDASSSLSLTKGGILKTAGKPSGAPKRVVFSPDVAVKKFEVEKINRPNYFKSRRNPDKLNEVDATTGNPVNQTSVLSFGTLKRRDASIFPSIGGPKVSPKFFFEPAVATRGNNIKDIELTTPTRTVREADFDDAAKSRYLEELGLEYRLDSPGFLTVRQGFRRPGLQEDPDFSANLNFTPWQ